MPIKEDLAKGGKFISDLSERELLTREKIRVIINEFSQGQKLDCEKTKALKHPVYATIPKSDSPHYHKVFKRIARQIGEVRLGVALGSGGSYGFAHIGVLEVLEENNIDIDIICGSSMGSLVAAMWAAGFSVDKMKQVAANFGKKLNLFSFPGFYFPFKGIIKAKRSEKIYKEIFGGLTFHDLKHDLKLASFDFYKRKAAVLDEGLLYKAVAASCAIPGVFEPVKMKKNLMLDGGVLNPLPSKILLNYGVNKIIAINVTPPLEKVALRQKIKGKWHIFDFIFGTIETMQREFIDAALKVSDVVIHPVFEATDWAHFENVDEYIEAGRKAALGKLNDIKELSER
ncbi:MAG: hypothetical protein GY858_05840 [Candidatus Omnitrophica bacterium]|nr:hypothetical protein [Candidatus Omnitrophota bacterium]